MTAQVEEPLPAPLNQVADSSPVRCLDPTASRAMVAEIDQAIADRDTLGGIAEVVVRGVVVGLGSHVSWDRKLDARLAQALMSIHAVKGVEIGLGFTGAGTRGSEAHDEIRRGDNRLTGGVERSSNRAGGLEGGITNGEPLVLRLAMKPISTLRRPLDTLNVETGEAAQAQSERSDITAVPAMGVIAEAMTAIVLAQAMAEKFGGDSLVEMQRNYDNYLEQLRLPREEV